MEVGLPESLAFSVMTSLWEKRGNGAEMLPNLAQAVLAREPVKVRQEGKG